MSIILLLIAVGLLWHFGKLAQIGNYLRGQWHSNRKLVLIVGLLALVLFNPLLAGNTIFLVCGILGVWYMLRRTR